MNKRCRVLITSECNLRCEYCCNKLPEVQATIKMTTMDQFIEEIAPKYEEISISGGEPMLAEDKLINIIYSLPENAKKYLYTNGSYSPSIIFPIHLLNGVNIGVHQELNSSDLLCWLKEIAESNPTCSLRFHMQEGVSFPNTEEFAILYNIPIIRWQMNKCGDPTTEDRYII